MILLAIGNGMHASDGELYPNPFDSQFDDNEHIQLRGDSFQQAINQKDEHGNTFLRHAVIKNNIKKVKRLIEFGADVNSQCKCRCGNTNLHSAVYKENEQMVQLLLDADADVNQQDNQGWTPLHIAVLRDNHEIIQLLLAYGADTTIRNNDGYRARWYATNKITRAILDETTVQQDNNPCSIS